MYVPQVDKPQCPNPNKEDQRKDATTFNARYEEVLTLWSVADDFLPLFLNYPCPGTGRSLENVLTCLPSLVGLLLSRSIQGTSHGH